MNVKFIELKRQYLKYEDAYNNAITNCIKSGNYILGNELSRFEKDYAEYFGVKYCAGVNSGLDALKISLNAIGVQQGDEVIVQSNTFIATALAISENGATPIFIDSDEYFGIDVSLLERSITAKTKAIIVVHLYGQPSEMSKILELSKKYNLYLIEDCAQAHGAKYKSEYVGTIGDIGCFSFYPTKPIGAFGDGGAIITNSKVLHEKIRMIRNYGSTEKYYHDILGINSRLDEVQASILRVSLRYFEEGFEERGRIARLYLENIRNPKINLPLLRSNTTHAWHIFPILTEMRDSLQEYLILNGIETQIHYPIPCHLSKCYTSLLNNIPNLNMTELQSKSELSLPIYNGMNDDEINYIIEIINKF